MINYSQSIKISQLDEVGGIHPVSGHIIIEW